jgi:hypothetical protein
MNITVSCLYSLLRLWNLLDAVKPRFLSMLFECVSKMGTVKQISGTASCEIDRPDARHAQWISARTHFNFDSQLPQPTGSCYIHYFTTRQSSRDPSLPTISQVLSRNSPMTFLLKTTTDVELLRLNMCRRRRKLGLHILCK